MKILHILHRSIPGNHGYAVRSREIVNNEAALGLEPIVLTSPSQAPAGRLNSQGAEILDGIEYYRTRADFLPPTIDVSDQSPTRSAIRIMLNGLTLKKAIELTRKYKPAVIHSHSPFTCGLVGNLTGLMTRTPKIYEMRGIWEDSHTSRYGLSVKSPTYRTVRALETRAAIGADRVVALSHALVDEMISRGIKRDKIVYIPNGVDVGRFEPGPAPEKIRKRLGFEGAFVIGYIGSFFRYEGLDILARAFVEIAKEFDSARLMLVGAGELGPELEKIVFDAGLNEKVVFTGKVPHTQVDDYYKLCDLMILPRRETRETRLVTPLKPMEIMAMRKPLILSNIGGHREIVEDEKNGIFFKAEDVDDLVHKIRLLITNQDYRNSLAEKGREWVVNNRNWSALATRYLQLYESLARK